MMSPDLPVMPAPESGPALGPEPVGRRWLPFSGSHGPAAPPAGNPVLPAALTAAMLVIGALLHYGDMLPLLSAAADHSPVGLTTRQTVERILIMLPVIYATLAFGARGGIITAVVALAVLCPRVLMSSGHTDHALPEMGGIMVVGGLLILAITQQRREVEIQKRMRDSLRYFVRQVLTSQEDERKRIAMELHDETAQALLLSCQRLDRLVAGEGYRLPADVSSELQGLRTATVGTLTDLRRLTQHLRPRVFDDHGLVAALEWLADGLREQYGIEGRVEAAGALPEHSPETQLLLFRIAQEALRNVGRHSGATRAVVSLQARRDGITMTVADDGRGFRLAEPLSELAQKGKLGLLGMDERARLLGGSLDIRSQPHRGTTITVELPYSGRGISEAPSLSRSQFRWPGSAQTPAT
jgi:two-component system sensor histidine kinase DegS